MYKTDKGVHLYISVYNIFIKIFGDEFCHIANI